MSPSSSNNSIEGDESFPSMQLFVLAICRLAEPIAFTSIVAYTYVFVEYLRPWDTANAAFYAGLLVSAFALAEALAAIPWGAVSDRYGRKPVVLFGLAGVAVSNLIFGVSTNYWVAFGARVIGGLLNGNVGVMQTMVAEMCKKPEHEPVAYTMIPFVWSAGSIFGAAMGGFLARPNDTWPSIFPKTSIFTRFPYLLPNFVAAAFIIFAIILGAFLLKETNINARSPFSARLDVTDEQTPLLNNNSAIHKPDEQLTMDRRPSFPSMPPMTVGATVDVRRLSVSTAPESIKPNATTETGEQAEYPAIEEQPETPKLGYSRAMVLLIAQLFLMSYQSMGFASLTPIFMLDKPKSSGTTSGSSLDLQGGLAYTLQDVGTFMAVNGAVQLVFQAAILPAFMNKVGIWRSVKLMTCVCPFVYMVVPFLTAIPRPQLLVGVYAAQIIESFALMVIYPCLLIALKNATPSMAMLGQVNGLAMAACSGSRTIAPPAAGLVYDRAGSAAGWWSVGLVALSAAILLLFMRPPPKEQGDKEP